MDSDKRERKCLAWQWISAHWLHFVVGDYDCRMDSDFPFILVANFALSPLQNTSV
jgi:hypothetical protein